MPPLTRRPRYLSFRITRCIYLKMILYHSFLINTINVEMIYTGVVCKNGSYIFVNVYRAFGVPIECKEYCNKLVNHSLDYIATWYNNNRLNNPVITIVGDFNLPDVS